MTTTTSLQDRIDSTLRHISDAIEDCETGRPGFALTQLHEAMHYAKEAAAAIRALSADRGEAVAAQPVAWVRWSSTAGYAWGTIHLSDAGVVNGDWRSVPIYAIPPSDRGDAVAWFTDDHLSDRSATTYDKVVAERWRAKGWPVTPLYGTPPSPAESAEDRFEQFCAAGIARSPEPLRELGEYLATVLDEDKFPTADRLLLQLATASAAPSGVSDAMVDSAARALCQRFAAECGGDAPDAWAKLSQHFKDDARAALEASQPQPGRVEGMDADNVDDEEPCSFCLQSGCNGECGGDQ